MLKQLQEQFDRAGEQAQQYIVHDEYEDTLTQQGAEGFNAYTSEDAMQYIVSLPSNKIELAKISARTAIARRHAEYATIDNITREDMIAFYKRFYHPNNTMMTVWGDFDTKEMVVKITEAFKDWARADLDVPPVPQVEYEFRPAVNLVVKGDINQSVIRMGRLGGVMSDPDYFALMVMNEILGSGFTSRLFKNVRSRQGLAYSVDGAYGAGFDHPGVFYVACQTKLESTVHAIEAMTEEVRKMTQEEVTDEEPALAKDSFLNSFVFNFESRGQIVNRLLTYVYYGYPDDFLQKTKANVEKVTKADALRVARAHLRPDTLQILVVGRPDGFDQPLSTLGQVKTIDITIPPPLGQKE